MSWVDQMIMVPISELADVIQLPVKGVKYVKVEIKTPGFKAFESILPVKDDLNVLGLLDRFHNLHPDVENTIKRCGHLYPPIEYRLIYDAMDIVIEYSSSEWVRLTRVADQQIV